MKLIRIALALGACASLATGCAGPSTEFRKSMNERAKHRDFTGLAAAIREAKEHEYTSRDEVLYYLDLGAALHESGDYKDSELALDLAEQKLDALYTNSLHKGAGTFLLNDTTDDYRGEPHERALLHVLRALNFAYVGRSEDAAIEARKVSAFLTELNDKVGLKGASYRDDAFAQYMSGLLFEDLGKADDARISFAAAHSAYANYAAAYKTTEPSFETGPIGANEGEIVFLHYAGVAPRRVSKTIQVAWNDATAAVTASGDDQQKAQLQNTAIAALATDAITVAFPEFVQEPFTIVGSEIEVAGKKAPTVVVEDISAIAQKALVDRNTTIRARAVARATIKYIVTKLAEEKTKKEAGETWGKVMGFVGRTVSAATEMADTRCWGTLPAQIRMARVRVPAGKQVINVRYVTGQGQQPGEVLQVDVKPGRRTYVHVRTAI